MSRETDDIIKVNELGRERGRKDVLHEIEVYLTIELENAVKCAQWNLEKGFASEAYGWECKVVFIGSMAQDHRMGYLAEHAEKVRIELRNAREKFQGEQI